MKPAFFISDLAESLLGDEWRSLPHEASFCDPVAIAEAKGMIVPELLTPSFAGAIAEEYASNADRVAHVCLDRPIEAEFAEALHLALQSASFRPHHHAAYRIDIAPLEAPQPEALRRFTAWLASPEAGRLHLAWVGHPRWRESLRHVQVQVSRLREGQSFEPHVDTNDDSLAVVYNFTRDWTDGMGGVLRYTEGDRTLIQVVPRFNSVFLSDPRGALHEVTPVSSLAGKRARFTVTAFYVCG